VVWLKREAGLTLTSFAVEAWSKTKDETACHGGSHLLGFD